MHRQQRCSVISNLHTCVRYPHPFTKNWRLYFGFAVHHTYLICTHDSQCESHVNSQMRLVRWKHKFRLRAFKKSTKRFKICLMRCPRRTGRADAFAKSIRTSEICIFVTGPPMGKPSEAPKVSLEHPKAFQNRWCVTTKEEAPNFT